MNIVILRTNTADFGKVGTYNVQEIGLANSLRRLGHIVSVLYLHRKTESIVKDEKYDFVYYLPHKTFGLHGIFKTKLLSEFIPERVILFSDNQLWAKNVILWCRKKNIQCVHYFGNVLSDNPRWINQFYTKLILYRNRKSYNYSINVAKTEKVRYELEKHSIPFSRVINVGLDSDILVNKFNCDMNTRKALGFADNEIVLLFVGRLVDYKKPFLACDILLELLKRGINCRLCMIGKGILEEELESYISKNSLENNVTWMKRVEYSEMYKYMISCDAFINLSPKEIFGMAILESMYYGLPVVANCAPGPNAIIENEKSGYLCDFGEDEKKWADQIILAIKNKESISTAARKRIEENFFWDCVAEKFLQD